MGKRAESHSISTWYIYIDLCGEGNSTNNIGNIRNICYTFLEIFNIYHRSGNWSFINYDFVSTVD